MLHLPPLAFIWPLKRSAVLVLAKLQTYLYLVTIHGGAMHRLNQECVNPCTVQPLISHPQFMHPKEANMAAWGVCYQSPYHANQV